MSLYAILTECDPGSTLGGSCFRDVNNMAKYLINKCDFTPSNIYILTTPGTNIFTHITGVNYSYNSTDIFDVYSIIINFNPKLIVLLLSGHGFSVVDINGDETDRADESITFGKGMIIDDILYDKFVDADKSDMLLFSDTCHSGTMFDLPYSWTSLGWTPNSNRLNPHIFKHNMISISACNDRQLSMCDIGEETGFGGSLTTALLNIPRILLDLIESFNSNNCTTSATNPTNNLRLITYQKIKTHLSLLNQTVVMSSSIRL
jgi:hypothetical protein